MLGHTVKGDNFLNGLVENAVLLLRGVIRITKCHVESCTQEELRKDSPHLAVVGGTCEEHFVARSLHKNVCHSERRCWRDRYPHNR